MGLKNTNEGALQKEQLIEQLIAYQRMFDKTDSYEGVVLVQKMLRDANPNDNLIDTISGFEQYCRKELRSLQRTREAIGIVVGLLTKHTERL